MLTLITLKLQTHAVMYCVLYEQNHDVYTDSPVTYWGENIQSVTGVTQVKKSSVPFHKNTSFSTPIEEYLDQSKPHNIS